MRSPPARPSASRCSAARAPQPRVTPGPPISRSASSRARRRRPLAARVATLAHFRSAGLAADNKETARFDPVTVADRLSEERMRAILAAAAAAMAWSAPGRGA